MSIWRDQARRWLPERGRAALRRAVAPARSWFYAGNARECPCCGSRFRRFVPAGVSRRPEAACPRCGARERHRLLWLYLREKTSLFSEPHRVLHFAPEPALSDHLAALPNLDYLSADLDPARAMAQVDVTEIPHADDSFDVILCNHVLEHVPDDRRAMRELFRVLRPGGLAILQVPLTRRLETTYEDDAIRAPAARLAAFGQEDHVRLYGKDYPDRLREAGFTVVVDRYARELDEAIVALHGLKRERIYRCTKPGKGP